MLLSSNSMSGDFNLTRPCSAPYSLMHSSRRALVTLAAGLHLLLATGILSAEVFYSKRGLFDESTGYLQTDVDGIRYRGSGVVARDSRLIFSCAHLAYDNGVWADQFVFHRAYHSARTPESADGARPRGYRFLTGYSENNDNYGISASRTYANDFVIYYGNSGFGPAAGWWADGGAALRSSAKKRIIGYPSSVDYTGQVGYAYQHGTDWFSNRADRIRSPYHTIDDASTGRGNSGGPVFVWDEDSQEPLLAGILVSGTSKLAGMVALDDVSEGMANAALGLEPVVRTVSNRSKLKLPDGASSYSSRSVRPKSLSGGVVSLKCTVKISTKRQGDLNVYLKSPAGRIRWINKASSSSRNDVVLKDKNLTSRFKGSAAEGKWTLKMKDKREGTRATFKKLSLSVEALGE